MARIRHSSPRYPDTEKKQAANRLIPLGLAGYPSFWSENPVMRSTFIAFTVHGPNKITEPVLFLQGKKDEKSGTFPQPSERMFAAVKGTGGTTRLMMLPHESHGHRGRKSLLHTLAEMFDWFDTHVKNAEVADMAAESVEKEPEAAD